MQTWLQVPGNICFVACRHRRLIKDTRPKAQLLLTDDIFEKKKNPQTHTSKAGSRVRDVSFDVFTQVPSSLFSTWLPSGASLVLRMGLRRHHYFEDNAKGVSHRLSCCIFPQLCGTFLLSSIINIAYRCSRKLLTGKKLRWTHYLTCTKRHIDSRSQAGEESTTCESQIRTSLRSWWTPTPEVWEEWIVDRYSSTYSLIPNTTTNEW